MSEIESFWSDSIIQNRYVKPSRLGEGGNAVVYSASDIFLSKEVAIKVMKPRLSEDQALRFQREARSSGLLTHPNIVTILDFGISSSGIPYLVMDHVSGPTLEKYLRKVKKLSLWQSLPLLGQIARGMRHAHEHGVIHRDLKPANIVLTDISLAVPTVKILDFGLARIENESGHLTSSGKTAGTPLYMAPEQSSLDACDQRSDIYSFGCMIYEMLCGEPPYIGRSAMETILLHKTEVPLPLSERIEIAPVEIEDSSLRIELARQVDELISGCIAKAPADRFQTFAELVSIIDDLQSRLHDSTEKCVTGKSNPGTKNLLNAYSIPWRIAERWKDSSSMKFIFTIVSIGILFVLIFIATAGWENLEKATRNVVVSQSHFSIGIPAVKGTKSDVVDYLESSNVFKSKFTALVDSSGAEHLIFERSQTIEFSSEFKNESELKRLLPWKKLEHLSVISGGVTGSVFSNFKDISIRSININDCPVDLDGLKAILEIPGLEELTLHGITPALASAMQKDAALISKFSAIGKIRPGNPDANRKGGSVFLKSLIKKENDIELLLPWKKLDTLRIYGRRFEAGELDKLQKLSVKHLRIGKTEPSRDDFKAIAKIPGLSELYLESLNGVDEDFLVELAEMPSLTVLIIFNCSIKESALAYLPRFPKLRNFQVSKIILGREGLGYIQDSPELVVLSLEDCLISDDDLSYFPTREFYNVSLLKMPVSKSFMEVLASRNIKELQFYMVTMLPETLAMLENSKRVAQLVVFSPGAPTDLVERLSSTLPLRSKGDGYFSIDIHETDFPDHMTILEGAFEHERAQEKTGKFN